MSRFSLAVPISMAVLLLLPTSEALSHQKALLARRALLAKAGTTAIMGLLLTIPHEDDCQCGQCSSHGTACQCSSCLDDGEQHGAGCYCGVCAPSFFRPPTANAYIERDVGPPDRSTLTEAFNIRARETNARLEKEGFEMDTREEEAQRLSVAMASSSYDSMTERPNKQVGRGFGNKKQPSKPETK